MNRKELQNALIERIIDDMDQRALSQLAYEYLDANYDKYSHDELKTEAADFYPDLLEG